MCCPFTLLPYGGAHYAIFTSGARNSRFQKPTFPDVTMYIMSVYLRLHAVCSPHCLSTYKVQSHFKPYKQAAALVNQLEPAASCKQFEACLISCSTTKFGVQLHLLHQCYYLTFTYVLFSQVCPFTHVLLPGIRMCHIFKLQIAWHSDVTYAAAAAKSCCTPCWGPVLPP